MSRAVNDPYLAIARVLGPHGVRGELRCQLITDFPERLARTLRVYVGETRRAMAVEGARPVKAGAVFKLAGINARNDAERLRGETLYIHQAEAVHLPPGSYFWHQVIGLRVVSMDGQDLGQVVDILQTPGNDVYVVRWGEREVLVPAIKDIVREVDPEAGLMKVEVIEGLL